MKQNFKCAILASLLIAVLFAAMLKPVSAAIFVKEEYIIDKDTVLAKNISVEGTGRLIIENCKVEMPEHWILGCANSVIVIKNATLRVKLIQLVQSSRIRVEHSTILGEPDVVVIEGYGRSEIVVKESRIRSVYTYNESQARIEGSKLNETLVTGSSNFELVNSEAKLLVVKDEGTLYAFNSTFHDLTAKGESRSSLSNIRAAIVSALESAKVEVRDSRGSANFYDKETLLMKVKGIGMILGSGSSEITIVNCTIAAEFKGIGGYGHVLLTGHSTCLIQNSEVESIIVFDSAVATVERSVIEGIYYDHKVFRAPLPLRIFGIIRDIPERVITMVMNLLAGLLKYLVWYIPIAITILVATFIMMKRKRL